MSEKLTIVIQSFSYRNGYPEDTSGNGGGYVFDCRGILNPYRFGDLRYKTGKDKEIEEFFLNNTAMPEFLSHIQQIVTISVDEYLKRNFNHLQLNFGCTGGQHRSVYSAEKTAKFIKEKYPQVEIIINHLNQKKWELEKLKL